MASKKKLKKSPRVKETGVVRRKGVTWRRDRGHYMVEMRVSNTDKKLHCGIYKDVNHAMIARDYAALIRNSTGKEALATVGGYDPTVHPDIYEFDKSPEIFGSLEGVEARCEEWKRILEDKTRDRREFNKGLREDIRVAIQEFESQFPQELLRNKPLNHVPEAILLQSTLPPSSSETRVSPSPGCEVGATMGDGSMNSSDIVTRVSLLIVVDGSLQTLLSKTVLKEILTAEEIFEITKAGVDKIDKDIEDRIVKYFGEFFEEAPPCTIDPLTIAPLE